MSMTNRLSLITQHSLLITRLIPHPSFSPEGDRLMERFRKIWQTTNRSFLVPALLVVAVSGIVAISQTPELAPFPPPKTEPPIVTPGRTAGAPPSDALVLLDGKD